MTVSTPALSAGVSLPVMPRAPALGPSCGAWARNFPFHAAFYPISESKLHENAGTATAPNARRKPQEPRRTGDESKNSPIDEVQDPEIADDEDRGYANTDEVTPNEHGLVRRG
jgi:hypothetical protein